MTEPANKVIEFGPFRLDCTERVLLRDGQPVSLTLKAFEVLLLLVECRGHVVEKHELMKRVWADTFVEEGNIKTTVSMLRKALADDDGESRYIETVPRRGYRFVAEVKGVPAKSLELVVHERTRESVIIDERPSVTGRLWLRPALYLPAGAALIILGIAGIFFLRSRFQPIVPARSNPPIKSIAVLPFKPLEAANRDVLLELGMADTLITRLGALKEVVVRPTSAVRKFNDLEQDPLAAGRELQADAILDGSIQRINDRIRINVRLIRVADGSTLWADRFDDRYHDLFAVEASISNKIASTLALTLGAQENRQLQKHYTDNPRAYEAYLRGRSHWFRQTPEDFKKAIAQFQEAINLDPRYALAYAGLADTYNLIGYWGFAPPREVCPKAKEAAKKSLEIDETLGEGKAALAYTEFEYDWDCAGAETTYRRAIDLSPGYASVHQWYAEYLMISGRLEEAAQELKAAREIDPISQPLNLIAAALPYLKRNYDEAIAQLQKVLELDPNVVIAYDWLASIYSRKGMHEDAVRTVERQLMLSGEDPQKIASLRKAFSTAGIQGFRRAHVEFLKEKSRRTYIAPIFIAMDYAEIGQNERAFEWLEKAYADRSGWLLELTIDPTWDTVRNDPRFKSLLERICTGSKPTT